MTLKNKLGIENLDELARVEEHISKRKAINMFEMGFLDSEKAGTYATLSKIHKYLFEDIYDFAGKIRTVNIAKGKFCFAPIMYFEEALKNIDKMPQSNLDEIIEKYVEMNIAHPFREGNGRSMRIWLDHILKKELGKCVDWSIVGKEAYIIAMDRSTIRDIEIKYLIKLALTDEVDSRDMYIKSIDMSYYYEGYNIYKSEEL